MAAPILIQSPACVPGKAAQAGPSPQDPASTWKTQKFLSPGFGSAQFQLLQQFGK